MYYKKNYEYTDYKQEVCADYVKVISHYVNDGDTITLNPEGPDIREEDFLPAQVTFIHSHELWFDTFIVNSIQIDISRTLSYFENSNEAYTGISSYRTRAIS